VKIGPADPKFSLLKRLLRKEKITQAQHVAHRACMPLGLYNVKSYTDYPKAAESR